MARLRASGQTKTVTIYYLNGRLPLASPENDEADTLAQGHWLEGKPAFDVAQWLNWHLLHTEQKTVWAVAHLWGLPLTFEVSRGWKECLVCSKRDLHQVPQQHGTLVKRPIPLVRCRRLYWASSHIRRITYAMTCVDMATGLLVLFLHVMQISKPSRGAWGVSLQPVAGRR